MVVKNPLDHGLANGRTVGNIEVVALGGSLAFSLELVVGKRRVEGFEAHVERHGGHLNW